MLDRMPAVWRHFILVLLAAILGWAASDLVPWLQGHTAWGNLAGAAVTILVAILTPLVRQYGVGAPDPSDGT